MTSEKGLKCLYKPIRQGREDRSLFGQKEPPKSPGGGGGQGAESKRRNKNRIIFNCPTSQTTIFLPPCLCLSALFPPVPSPLVLISPETGGLSCPAQPDALPAGPPPPFGGLRVSVSSPRAPCCLHFCPFLKLQFIFTQGVSLEGPHGHRRWAGRVVSSLLYSV